ILRELHIEEKPRLLVFNKIDKVPGEESYNLAYRYGAITISALDPSSFGPLLREIELHIWESRLEETHV
ncbi:MAG: GTPase HflX, partial [Nitrospirota bacterium]